MKDDDLGRIAVDGYDEAREDTLLQTAGEFYSRQMRGIAIVAWVNGLIAIALGVFSAMQFFRAEQVKQEIMYAALFVIAWSWLSVAKVMAWLWMARNRITREIKRLEIRIAAADQRRSRSD